MTTKLMQSSTKATAVGQLGLCMWAIVSALMSLVTRLPSLEILLFIFIISLLCSCTFLSINKSWHSIKSKPLSLWLFNIIGICGSATLFVLASKNAPQAHVNLINYLWPTLIILAAPLLPNEKFEAKYLISAILAFAGIAILLTQGQGLHALDFHYSKGYIYAFCSALSWASYTLTARGHTQQTHETIGLYCGIGAIAILASHPTLEFIIKPTYKELLLLIYMGITSHNLAYMCWGHGVSKGNLDYLAYSHTSAHLSQSGHWY